MGVIGEHHSVQQRVCSVAACPGMKCSELASSRHVQNLNTLTEIPRLRKCIYFSVV